MGARTFALVVAILARVSSNQMTCTSVEACFDTSTNAIATYYRTDTPDRCCELCSNVHENCSAWVLTGDKNCTLLREPTPETGSENCTSGYTRDARTHYGNGFGCLDDEYNKQFYDASGQVGYGQVCAPACLMGWWMQSCPKDVPFDVTAQPFCILSDEIGKGSRCALACTDDAMCGRGAYCHRPYGDSGIYIPNSGWLERGGICIYPRISTLIRPDGHQ